MWFEMLSILRYLSRMIILLVALLFPCSSPSYSQNYAHRNHQYDDKEISQSLIWMSNDLTQLQCLHKCYNDGHCLSFQYNPVGTTCAGFMDKFIDVSVPVVDQPGSMLFHISKPPGRVGSDCQVDLDCSSLAQSYCHQGWCRCNTGHDGTLGGTSCRSLAECTSFNDVFTLYINSVIVMNDIDVQAAVTRSECLQFCLDNPACTSADYDYILDVCCIQSIAWADAGGKLDGTSSIYDHYQRGCNW